MTAMATADRAAVLVPVRGRAWFRTSEDVRGEDEVTGLAVTADVTGWVVDVEVPQPHPELRSAAGVESAVRRAIAVALVHHLAANARDRVLTGDERYDAGEILAGRARLEAAPVEPSPPIEAAREPQTPPAVHVDERWGRRWTGRSDRDELQVTMSLLAGFESLTADEDFLQTASAELLRYALREAFHAADRASGEELAR